ARPELDAIAIFARFTSAGLPSSANIAWGFKPITTAVPVTAWRKLRRFIDEASLWSFMRNNLLSIVHSRIACQAGRGWRLVPGLPVQTMLCQSIAPVQIQFCIRWLLPPKAAHRLLMNLGGRLNQIKGRLPHTDPAMARATLYRLQTSH